MIRNWGKLLIALLVSGYICVMYEFMAGVRFIVIGLLMFVAAMGYLHLVRRQIRMGSIEEYKLLTKKESASLDCEIQNTGILPIPFASLLLERQGDEKTEKYAFPLYGKEERNISIPLDTGHAGVCRIGIKAIRIRDLLSLFSLDLKVGQGTTVIVLPDLNPVLVETSSTLQFSGEESAFSSGKRGADASDILGIREYEPGDRPQQIHWKLTQRTGELMVKEYGDPKRFGTALLYDGEVMPEPCLEALFSISYALGEAGVPHFLCLSTRQGWERQMVYDETSAREALLELLLRVSGRNCELKSLGEEDYRAEFGAHSCGQILRLTENLQLYQNQILLAELSDAGVKESLAGLRLQL